MNEELRQQLEQVLFHEEDIESIAPLIDAHVAQKEREARISEHRDYILPLVEKAHEYEQGSGSSGLQLFDNERLGRLRELQPPTTERRE